MTIIISLCPNNVFRDTGQGVIDAVTCFNDSVDYCNPPTAASYNQKLQDALDKLPEVNTACVEGKSSAIYCVHQ